MIISQSKILFLLIASAIACNTAMAQKMKDAPNSAEVVALRGNVAAAYGNTATKPSAAAVAPPEKKRTLAEQSDFLVGAYGYTLLPKGAVTHTGKAVQVSATQPTSGQLMDWDSFYRKHRGGLRLVPITNDQWTGTAPLDSLKPTLEAAAKSGLTTVISLNGYPVGLPKIQTLLPETK